MWVSRATTTDEAVLETLGYASLFSLPLTPLEIWRYLFQKASFSQVEAALSRLCAAKKLTERQGSFALRGEEALFQCREERYRASLRKLRKAELVAAYLARFSFVRAVFVCNSLALMNARDASDIDFFIITAPGALWRTRLLAVLPFKLLGLRPTEFRHRDLFCFSFFHTDASLDLRRFALPEGDPYLAVWAASLLPLHDPHGMLERILQESCIEETLPNTCEFPVLPKGRVSRISSWTVRVFGAFFERVAERQQQRVLPPALRTLVGKGSAVVLNEQALKFHSNDRRKQFRSSFLDKLRALGI